jgi:hypothetical protein
MLEISTSHQQIFKKLLHPVSFCDTVRTVAVGSNSLKPFTHASSTFWWFLQGAVVSGFFRFYDYRTPSVSKWLYRQRGSKDKKLGVTRTSEVA